MPNQFCELCITCIFKLYKQRQEFSYEIEEQIFSERTVSVLCASQSTCPSPDYKTGKSRGLLGRTTVELRRELDMCLLNFGEHSGALSY